MKFDIFFSISQTPVDGHTPTETEMFRNFFEQVEAADQLGYGVAWIAESHLSSEAQKSNKNPVVPHWKGEIGLNVDFLQISHKIFQRTKRIETGSAIMNILCMGGPVAAAERVSAFLSLHGLDPAENRKINVGFAAGRFDFMNRASGVGPRNPIEEAARRAFKGKVFNEASEIFLKLLRGDSLSSDDISQQSLSRKDFRSDEDWAKVQSASGNENTEYPLDRQWTFETLKIIPCEWRRELLNLCIGSHDPNTQIEVNKILPVQVFNLSITRPDVIEETHSRMADSYHKDGGPWDRAYMPRTIMVFLNEEDGLSDQAKGVKAQEEADSALGAYWTALEGTLDPAKVARAANNAVIGNAQTIAHQIVERFHPDDRLMLWFDFFNHDSARVIRNMTAFKEKVMPLVEEMRG
jgi:alkanesulfonate monooxygenase SsuD/methylene tetrahydromethanopterin reductase-like flavin-dependent oxidoreductase (luciferase family)